MATDTERPGGVPSLLRPLAEDLEARRARARLGGGAERIARQHEAGKLTARKRIDLLVEPGAFTELGIHAGVHHSVRGLEGKEAPADGVVTGYGRVDGRLVAVCAYDFTVMAGSMGTTGEIKVARLRELALTKRMPFVWLLDSAGARIQEAVGSLFAGTGDLFREEVIASGVIPQVAALMGPCAAGTAYIEPDLIVAWPSAEISVMGAEGAVEIVMRRQVEEAADPEAKRAELVAAYRRLIDVYVAARNGLVDDVIDPRETRPVICLALEMAEGRTTQRPWKRNAVVPV